MVVRKLKYEPSESLWKSVVVKAIRIGWPSALEASAQHLNKSTMKYLITAQFFEDVFPSLEDLHMLLKARDEFDFVTLCEVDTHHGRGLTTTIHEMSKKNEKLSEDNPDQIRAVAKREGFWIGDRVLADFWAWMQLRNELEPTRRPVDETSFVGIPSCMADMHCKEGRFLGNSETVLSGSWKGHLGIERGVAKVGWKGVRDVVHDVETKHGRIVWDESWAKQEDMF